MDDKQAEARCRKPLASLPGDQMYCIALFPRYNKQSWLFEMILSLHRAQGCSQMQACGVLAPRPKSKQEIIATPAIKQKRGVVFVVRCLRPYKDSSDLNQSQK